MTNIFDTQGYNSPFGYIGGVFNNVVDLFKPKDAMAFYAPYGTEPTQRQQDIIVSNPQVGKVPSSQLNVARSTPNITSSSGNRSISTPNPTPSGDNGQQGYQAPSFEDQLNAIFNPTADFLNQLEAQYRSEQPEAEAQVTSSFNRALTPIQEKEATELAGLDKQEGVVNRGETNALGEARQRFNELSQRNIAMFGTGTSAGPGAQELLSRETAKQFGSIGQEATAGRTEIESERTRVKTFTAKKKAELEEQKQEAIRNVQSEFRRGLLQINQSRAANESAKAQARLELLQQAQQQAFQIEQANTAFQRSIDMFEREKTANLAQVSAYQSENIVPAVLAQIQKIGALPIPTAQKQMLAQQIPGYNQVFGTQLVGFQSDEDKNQNDLSFDNTFGGGGSF